MANNLTFCDYINNANFMKIEDKDNYFNIVMKAIVDSKTNNFYSLDGNEINKYKYEVRFAKSALWRRID